VKAKLPDRIKKFLVVGPFGGLNLGDDAIAFSLANWIKKSGGWVGMTLAHASSGLDLGVNQAEPLPVQRRLKLGALKNVDHYDSVIIGGGQQLHEPRIPNPIWGNLATVWQFALTARFHKCRFILLAVGAEKKYSALGKLMLKNALNCCDYISARDEESASEIRKYTKKSVFCGADLAFALPLRSLIKTTSQDKKRKLLVLWVLSNDKFHDLKYLSPVHSVVNALSNRSVKSHFSLSDLQEGYDKVLRTHEMLHFDKGSEWVDGRPHSLDLLIQQIVAANCVVSSRMHVLILAAIHGIPFVALNRAGKMEALLRAIQYPVKLQARLKNVSAAWLLEAILYALSETTLIRQKLLAAAKKQRSEVDNDLNRMSEVLQNRKSD